MTRRVSVSEQGELQGAVASLRGIAMIVGPGVFAAVFAYYIAPSRFIPGAPWFLSAILLLAALGLAWVVAPKAGRSNEKEPSSPVTTLA
jgi:DHA1 family tetracycline resistance protein-like MFS transporter